MYACETDTCWVNGEKGNVLMRTASVYTGSSHPESLSWLSVPLSPRKADDRVIPLRQQMAECLKVA